MMPSLDTFPVPLIHINETNSTNNYLQSLCSEQKVEELTVIVADFQTSGRGQRGNSWESDPGKNLLFSTVIFPEFLEARRQFLISQIISLAIKEELDTYTSDISIKWPNDIYWKEKKICGMLIENDLMGRNINQSIAGIGININQEIFHSSAPNPVSLIPNILPIIIGDGKGGCQGGFSVLWSFHGWSKGVLAKIPGKGRETAGAGRANRRGRWFPPGRAGNRWG